MARSGPRRIRRQSGRIADMMARLIRARNARAPLQSLSRPHQAGDETAGSFRRDCGCHLQTIQQLDAGNGPGSFDYEHFARREFIREQLGSVLAHDDHVLNVPVAAMRLDRQDHAFFQHDTAFARHDGLLLMPPAADAVPDKHRLVIPPLLVEFLDHKPKNLAGANARLAAFDGLIVNIANNPIFALLFGAWLPQDGVPRLMAGIALSAISNVIVADDVAALERGVAFAAVIYLVRA